MSLPGYIKSGRMSQVLNWDASYTLKIEVKEAGHTFGHYVVLVTAVCVIPSAAIATPSIKWKDPVVGNLQIVSDFIYLSDTGHLNTLINSKSIVSDGSEPITIEFTPDGSPGCLINVYASAVLVGR